MAEAQLPPTLSDADKQALQEQVDKTVADRLKQWSEAITNTKIEEKQKPTATREQYFLIWAFTPLPLLLALIFKWVTFSYFGETIDLLPRLREIPHQIAVLAFVVALAAYLANVTREGIKSLRDIEVSKQEEVNINTIRQNLAWVTEVEVHLVLLGIIASLRLIVGAKWQAVTGYSAGAIDNFLLIYLAIIIINLAILHMRQWYMHNPFKAVVKIR